MKSSWEKKTIRTNERKSEWMVQWMNEWAAYDDDDDDHVEAQ